MQQPAPASAPSATPSRFTKIDHAGQPLPIEADSWPIVHEPARGLMWTTDDVLDADLTDEEAQKACADLDLGGFTDWRLPTVEELFALPDRTKWNPAIDTAAFPSCKSRAYWTSTPWAPSPASAAWSVDFCYGYSGGYGRSSRARVRAVRSVVSPGQ